MKRVYISRQGQVLAVVTSDGRTLGGAAGLEAGTFRCEVVVGEAVPIGIPPASAQFSHERGKAMRVRRFAQEGITNRQQALDFYALKGIDTTSITDQVPDDFLIAVAASWQAEEQAESQTEQQPQQFSHPSRGRTTGKPSPKLAAELAQLTLRTKARYQGQRRQGDRPA